jgi:hypothetical protein
MSTIHLTEAVTAPSDSLAAFTEDISAALRKGPAVLGISGAATRHKALLRLAKEFGYTVIHPTFPEDKFSDLKTKRVTDALLVKDGNEVTASGWAFGVAGRNGTPAKGGHLPLGHTWARVRIGDELVWVGIGSSLRQLKTEDASRTKDNETLAKKGATLAKREGKKRLAFLLGDSHAAASNDQELSSIWAGRAAPKGEVSTVLAGDASQRITGSRVRRSKANSATDQLSVWYEVADQFSTALTGALSATDYNSSSAPLLVQAPAEQIDKITVKKTAKKTPAKKAAAKKK